jgi:hypothetical protein
MMCADLTAEFSALSGGRLPVTGGGGLLPRAIRPEIGTRRAVVGILTHAARPSGVPLVVDGTACSIQGLLHTTWVSRVGRFTGGPAGKHGELATCAIGPRNP